MYSLIYRSKAQPALGEDSIRAMIEKAQIRNRERDITGCLLYHNRKFVQFIEGEEDKVQELYATILEDPRHTDVTLLYNETQPNRLFTDWNMIYNNLDEHSGQANEKRQLFDAIFHQPGVVESLGKSKLVLWKQVYALLDEEGVLQEEKI